MVIIINILITFEFFYWKLFFYISFISIGENKLGRVKMKASLSVNINRTAAEESINDLRDIKPFHYITLVMIS